MPVITDPGYPDPWEDPLNPGSGDPAYVQVVMRGASGGMAALVYSEVWDAATRALYPNGVWVPLASLTHVS